MKINIIGPGAMGIILAYFLSRKNDVSLTVKNGQEKIYRTIKVIEEGKDNTFSIPVYSENVKADLTIIAVKSYDLDNVLNTYKIEGKVLFIQNGLKHLNIDIKGIEKYYAVTTWAGRRIEKGIVEITGKGYFRVGGKMEMDLTPFTDSGINAEWSSDIIAEIYRKAAINSVINPLTSIFRVNNGMITKNPHLWNIARMIAAEDSELFGRLGYSLNVEQDVKETCNVTSRNTSSMLQDIMNRRKTEIESITGEMLRIGERFGLRMPLNRFMLNSIHFMENNQN